MIRSLAFALVVAVPTLVMPSQADAAPGDPFSSRSTFPIGVAEKGKVFAAFDLKLHGKITQFQPVAYSAPKGKKARRVKLRSYTRDVTDNTTAEKSDKRIAPIIERNDAAFAKAGLVEATPIRGGFTGRYRIPDLGMVVYVEDDKVFARTGDISFMKKLVLIPSVKKLGGRCDGDVESKLLHVVVRPDWKSVASYVSVTCDPEDVDVPSTEVRKLVVSDVSSLVK